MYYYYVYKVYAASICQKNKTKNEKQSERQCSSNENEIKEVYLNASFKALQTFAW